MPWYIPHCCGSLMLRDGIARARTSGGKGEPALVVESSLWRCRCCRARLAEPERWTPAAEVVRRNGRC